jgi:mono/diheme cytochrome c family protein
MMSFSTVARGLAGLTLIAVVVAGIWYGRRQPAEVAEGPPPVPQAAIVPAPEADAPPADYNQRSLEIFEFKRVATSGAGRGKEIYYYKCWFCHNDFAEGAPKLVGVYQRGTLITGRPATDDGIKEQIREGSAGMASYKYTLSETDIDDLVTFIREGCCWKDDEPPLNPRYVAK